ncbi:MAG TPA: glycosyl hydrolase family 65 protein [Gemmatimonadales bacterium]|nr:glycosyl hydrolase family 65 protein [Gemmatimonadales bacterium]
MKRAAALASGAQLVAALGLSAQSPARPEADSTFYLSTTDVARTPSPYLGNGRLGLVVPPLGIGSAPSFMAGLYEAAPDDVPRIVSIPSWTAIDVFDGRRWLEPEQPDKGSVDAYTQVLDMRSGVVRTSFHWVSGSGRMSVRVQTFVSRSHPDLGVIRLDLAPQYAGRVGVRFAIVGQPPPRRLPLDTLSAADPNWKPADIWYPGHMTVQARQASRISRGARLAMSSSPEGRRKILAQAAEITWPRLPTNSAVRTVAQGDTALVELMFDARRGQNYTFVQTTSALAAETGKNLLPRAVHGAQAAGSRGFRSLADEHAAAWARRWRSDIEIEGDPALQRVARSMLFYLLCSADSGTALGIPPMGLSSGGYYGHIFWDSDTWMFPSLLATHPDVARSLVSFRWRTLEAARANAKSNGFRGAMYPWEADELGEETTPHFAVQNARSEIHVNGDVALAQWQYFQATGDRRWLEREGYPVIRETADFWVSRSSYDSADQRYHINNVVSVSEGLIGVSDDAYTNAVARLNLQIATRASRSLGQRADPRWSEVAAKLHMPYDSASEFYRTYEGAPDSTLGDVTPLLSYPLGVPMSERAKRSQLEQAVKRLLSGGPGAMMGSTLLAVDAAELGDRRLLDSLLPHSYQGWLQGPFLMLSETPDKKDAVNFVTGAGGFLQQVIYGYTGLRWGEKGLEPAFAPLLPSRIKRLTVRNVYSRGKRYDVTVDANGRRMTLAKSK